MHLGVKPLDTWCVYFVQRQSSQRGLDVVAGDAAVAYIGWQDSAHPASRASRRLLLLPDLGTAPVARYRQMLRRVVVYTHSGQVKGQLRECDELLVATPDLDGRGLRAAAWCTLLARLARREEAEPPPVRVVTWSQVGERLHGPVTRALVGGRQHGTAPAPGGKSRGQVLHLLGRHPLLTVRHLADLLGMRRAPIERFERELIELGWLRTLDDIDLRASGLELDAREFGRLGLVQVTGAGRRHLADLLGLDAPTAHRYHGLMGSGPAATARRRRLLRTLAHTLGTNDVFVAFALAAAAARRAGGTDELSEWRAAAACERQRCKPDGYGLYTRDGVGYGFLLEYDRRHRIGADTRPSSAPTTAIATAGRRRGITRACRRSCSSRPARGAEDRISEQAYRAWFARGTKSLPVLLTTTACIIGES